MKAISCARSIMDDVQLKSVQPTEEYWVDRWEYEPLPWEIAVLTSAVSALLAVVGGLTNGLVMYLIMQMNKCREILNTDILILSLCFSDFLSSVVVQPQLIPRILSRPRVPAVQSRSLHVSVHFTIITGALSLLFLTVNRYISVKFPFFYGSHVTEKKTYGCVAGIFTATFAMITWIIIDGESELRLFPILSSVIFSLTIIFQVMIFAIVRAKNHTMHRQIMAVEHNQSASSWMARRTNAQRTKANGTILYICAVYITLWLPSIVFRICYVFHGDLTLYIQWIHVFNVVIQLHSCINPFLYVLRTTRAKQKFIRMFRARFTEHLNQHTRIRYSHTTPRWII